MHWVLACRLLLSRKSLIGSLVIGGSLHHHLMVSVYKHDPYFAVLSKIKRHWLNISWCEKFFFLIRVPANSSFRDCWRKGIISFSVFSIFLIAKIVTKESDVFWLVKTSNSKKQFFCILKFGKTTSFLQLSVHWCRRMTVVAVPKSEVQKTQNCENLQKFFKDMAQQLMIGSWMVYQSFLFDVAAIAGLYTHP